MKLDGNVCVWLVRMILNMFMVIFLTLHQSENTNV